MIERPAERGMAPSPVCSIQNRTQVYSSMLAAVASRWGWINREAKRRESPAAQRT